MSNSKKKKKIATTKRDNSCTPHCTLTKRKQDKADRGKGFIVSVSGGETPAAHGSRSERHWKTGARERTAIKETRAAVGFVFSSFRFRQICRADGGQHWSRGCRVGSWKDPFRISEPPSRCTGAAGSDERVGRGVCNCERGVRRRGASSHTKAVPPECCFNTALLSSIHCRWWSPVFLNPTPQENLKSVSS